LLARGQVTALTLDIPFRRAISVSLGPLVAASDRLVAEPLDM
jgi:hypothetical protein